MLASNLLPSGASAWTPRNLGSTLIGWFESDFGVALSGSNVDGWLDQTGNNNTLLASGSARPTFNASSNAGFPEISFNGTSNIMVGTSGGAITTRSAFAVLSSIGANAATASFVGSCRLYLKLLLANQLTLSITGQPTSLQTITTPSQVGCVINAANNVDFYLSTTLSNSVLGSSYSDTGLTLGADASVSQFAQFGIQSLVLCDTALSGGDVALLQAYFTRKYGV